jgi:SpoVK/Ycf46/Vps4 family AAA+-type ATPase
MTEASLLSMMPMISLLLNKSHEQMYIVFIFILQFILQNSDRLFTVLSNTKYISFFKNKNLTYNITAKISYKNNILWYNDISVSFKAVLYDLLKALKNNTNTKYTIEELSIGTFNKQTIKFVSLKKNQFKLSPTLLISTDEKEELSQKEDNKYITYTIKLESTKYSMDEILNYIDECIEKYTKEQLTQHKNQHIFIFESINKDTSELDFHTYPFNTTKSFDNMFFSQKQEIIRKINYFNDEEKTYKRLGINQTLGFLFYGKTGVGKTCCLKAIAKYTKRHIFVIPIKKITSIEVLKKIFLTSEINNVHIPNEQRLYIFEEIDCGQWKNVVTSRSIKDKDNNNNNDIEDLSKDIVDNIVTKLTCKTEKESKTEKNELTLGDFLELLDGIIEIPKRMIIMTSNHPEKLDSALIRPGRIDMIVHFKNMTKDDVSKMYELWFNKNIPRGVYNNMRDYDFSQAQIGSLFSVQDLDTIHNSLILGKIKSEDTIFNIDD